MTAFADRVDAFFAEYFRLQPIAATEAGMHAYDGSWPDLTEEGREARLELADRWTRELSAIPDQSLDAGERLDRDLLLAELAAQRFAETELREERWDALSYVYLLGSGIFPLLAREFAPLSDRLLSAARRMDGVPAVVAAARRELRGIEDRPVSRLHVEKAIRQLEGIVGLCDEAVQAGEAAAPGDPAVASIQGRLAAAAEIARASLGELQALLSDDLLPRSEGEGRLGPDLFDRKLRHTLHGDVSSDEILRRAEREFDAVRAEMLALARRLWPEWVPVRPVPEAEPGSDRAAHEGTIVRTVLDAIATVHPEPEELLDFCKAELTRIESFVAERGLVRLGEEPLEVIWTPVFLRAAAGAMLVPPGPLDLDQRSFFCITPPPPEWTPEQVESALREDNARMLRLLTIHEAVPGHYLQLAYANRCRSLTRAVLRDGVFAEGWAVYVTQVMLDLGYGADDPALMLVHWKFYLRAVTNAIIDVRIHRGPMTEEEAIRLMVEGGFQEEAEARAKWDRARLTSTQLCTYFVGSSQMWDLEHERRRQLAAASGDPRGADAVPEPRTVGGFGETPGFRYPEYLEAVLAHGTPPIGLLRRTILGG